MPSTYEPIATTTLGSAASSVTFSSIPSTYTDLILVSNGSVASDADLYMVFNSDSGNNYSRTYLYGDGSSAGSGRQSNLTSAAAIYFTTSQTSNITNIQNYSNSTTYKTVLSHNNTTGFVIALVNLWRSTSAITSITLTSSAGNITVGSTFTLYGVKSA